MSRGSTRPPLAPARPAPAAASAAPNPRERLPRSIALAALAGLALLFIALSLQKIYVPDLWWQLRTGQLVLERGWPSTDWLSFTAQDRPWVELRWIYCVVCYLLYSAGGPALLIITQVFHYAAVLALLCWPGRRALLTLPGLITLALTLGTVSLRFNIRPEMASYLFMAISLLLLDRATRPEAPPSARKLLWLLPALQVVWTNSHTVFIFGPILAWAFAGGTMLQRLLIDRGPHGPSAARPPIIDRTLFLVALAVTGACFINPWFERGAFFPFLLFTQTMSGELAASIEELTPPLTINPWPPDLYVALLMVLWSGVSFLFTLPRINLIRLGLWAAFLYLLATSVRNVGPFGFLALWATLRNLEDAGDRPAALWRGIASALPAAARRVPSLCALTLAVSAAALSWFIMTDGYANWLNSKRRFGVGVVPWVVPESAVDFLREHKPKGNVFHSMDDGSYLSFIAPDLYPVFIDGRLEVYPPPFTLRAINLLELAPKWDSFADEYNINTVVVHRELMFPLIELLHVGGRWTLVHLDGRTLIFVRNMPEHTGLIERLRIDPMQPWTPREPLPSEQPGALARALGAKGFPWHTSGLASAFLRLRAVDNAQVVLERGVKEFPEHRVMRILLAQIYRARNRTTDAAALLRGMDLSETERSWSEGMGVGIRQVVQLQEVPATVAIRANELYDRGDYAGAAREYERISRVQSNEHNTWVRLADCYEKLSRHPEAAQAYEQVVRIKPDLWQAWFRLGYVRTLLNDFDGAEKAYTRALEINPNVPETRQMLDDLRRQRRGG